MSNIVVPAAADWTEEETERNLEVLQSMGLTDDVEQVKKIRSSAKRKGELGNSGLAPSGMEDDEKSK